LLRDRRVDRSVVQLHRSVNSTPNQTHATNVDGQKAAPLASRFQSATVSTSDGDFATSSTSLLSFADLRNNIASQPASPQYVAIASTNVRRTQQRTLNSDWGTANAGREGKGEASYSTKLAVERDRCASDRRPAGTSL